MAIYVGTKNDTEDLATQGDLIGGGSVEWQSHTPVLTATTTNPTLGSGSSATGRYIQIGDLVVYYFKVAFGTSGTNAGSGDYRISVPVTATSSLDGIHIGTGRITNGSSLMTTFYFPGTYGVVEIAYGSSFGEIVTVSSAEPAAWSASDYIQGHIIYEAA